MAIRLPFFTASPSKANKKDPAMGSGINETGSQVMGSVSQRGILSGRGTTAVLIVLLSLAIPAYADGLDQVRDFDIEEQALNTALIEFSEQAGVQLMVPTELVADLRSPSIAGRYAADKALVVLLGGSELTFQAIGDDTVTLQAADQGGDSDSKNSSPAPILMAQSTSSRIQTTASSRSNEGGSSVVTGRVTDARTGVNLKGAKVTIEETGEWTRTNNLGVFRFVNVPMGSATLTISFLGYAGQSAEIGVQGGSVSQDFALRGGSEIEEIVVFGQRSARVQALNMERTAQNTTTVLSADTLGAFNGTTISEALRRAPGISFIQDETTGDGANVIVRGIEPDLNQVQLNGVRLLDGAGLGRSPDLSNILTESIESVTINKSLLPSQDSNGAGALIEIEIKSPLDRSRRFASFSAEYGERGNDFGDEFQVGGTLSGTFGSNDDFGVSVSGSYRERDITTIEYRLSNIQFGQYLPLDAAGDPIRIPILEIDPTTAFPFESGIDEVYPGGTVATQGDVDNKILSVTGVLEKQFGNHTSIRFDATYNQREDESYQSSTRVSSGIGYDLGPVAELGGEQRFILVSEDTGRNIGSPSAFPEAVRGFVERSATYSPSVETDSIVLSLRGDTTVDLWDFNYRVGYTESNSDSGGLFEYAFDTQVFLRDSFRTFVADRSLLSDSAIANQTEDGRIVSIYAPLQGGSDSQFILPLFNQAGFDFYNDIANLGSIREFEERGPRESESDAITGGFSVRRNLEHPVFRYLEAGATYQDTEFFSPGDIGGITFGGRSFSVTDGTSFSDLGFAFGPGLLTSVGASRDFAALTRGSVEAVSNSVDDLLERGLLSLVRDSDRLDTSDRRTQEETFSAYFETQLNFGKLELVGGVRVEHLDLSSTFFSIPSVTLSDLSRPDLSEFQEFATDSATQTDVLPRLAATYRHSDNLVFRAAYFTTVTQPQLSLLTERDTTSLRERFFFEPDFLPPAVFVVDRGNPDLEPATTHNYSFDVEYYTDDAGVFSASLFAKQIENSLQSNLVRGDQGVLPADFVFPEALQGFDIPEGTEFQFTIPSNSDSVDTIWGIELNAFQQLSLLPSPWDGMGILANYTYTDSERDVVFDVSEEIDADREVTVTGVPFSESPEHQGTAGLTYTKYGIDASLLYTAQSRRLSNFDRFFTSSYNEAFETLDFQFIYTRDLQGSTVSFFFRGNDLLRDDDEAFLRQSVGGQGGVPKYFTNATYLGGRTFVLGMSGTFGL